MPLYRFDYTDDLNAEPLTAYVESPTLDFAFATWHRETGMPARCIDAITKVGESVLRGDDAQPTGRETIHAGCFHPDYCLVRK